MATPNRIHNFTAGPAALPLPVLARAQEELLDYQGKGMSIMEMSHRSAEFSEVIAAAEENVRQLMNIDDDYAVLFLQGGASMQFAMLPTNLLGEDTADYINTGAWSAKAIKEAQIRGRVNVAWDGKDDAYTRIPAFCEIEHTAGAAYLHICSNETIGGIQYKDFPDAATPLVADMSSDIMSREIDVNAFGMIYAGAQKNIGPSGLALVIMRKDLAERCPDTVNTMLRYSTHIDKGSLFNTPNTWAIYLVKLVTEWVAEQGGVAALEKKNAAKAELLYGAIDGSEFWRAVAEKESRSVMNVTWTTPSADLDATFVSEATAAGLAGLKGHRSVGGLRASIYNACPQAAVEALVSFMAEFEKNHG